MDLLGGVVYINLDRRTDRREQIEEVLGVLGLSGERFAAIATCPGIIGCGKSHLAVLKMARERGWRNVLIFEDDFEPLVPTEEFWSTVRAGLAEVGEDWDVLMLSYHLEAKEDAGEHLWKVHSGQTTSGYMVNARFYDTLIELYEWANPELERTGRHWEYAVDQVWKRLQPAARWFAFKQRLGRQRASMADCGPAPSWANYGI